MLKSLSMRFLLLVSVLWVGIDGKRDIAGAKIDSEWFGLERDTTGSDEALFQDVDSRAFSGDSLDIKRHSSSGLEKEEDHIDAIIDEMSRSTIDYHNPVLSPSLLEVNAMSNVSIGAYDIGAAVNKVWEVWSAGVASFENYSSPLTAEIVKAYAQECLEGYKAVGYHDASHGYDVFKFVVNVFWQTPDDILPKMNKEAAALAALCHDFGHPGLNNKAIYYVAQAGNAKYKSIPYNIDFLKAINVPYENGVAETELDAAKEVALNSPGATDANIAPPPDKAFSKAGGAFCGHPDDAPLIPDNCQPQCAFCPFSPAAACKSAPCKPFSFFPGCGFNGGDCSSFEESYHAKKAVEILGKHAGVEEFYEYLNIVRDDILATDFGKDYYLRTVVQATIDAAASPDAVLAGELAVHISDINAASATNFAVWACGVIAEFVRQGIIGMSLGDSGLSPFPFLLAKFAAGQVSWSYGIKAWFLASFSLLKLDGTATAKERLSSLEANIKAWKGCGATEAKDKQGHPAMIIGESDKHYTNLKQLMAFDQACGAAKKKEKDAEAAVHKATSEADGGLTQVTNDVMSAMQERVTSCGGMAKTAKALLGWTQLEIKAAMLKMLMESCFSAIPEAGNTSPSWS
eukprot:gnl/MRDRNA2_/MRDRNA2_126476_c0_seq1.p1 gnl/MRDRNA2_/MRDRNA2_126476_c0~~gnl/MRDRNA2_/MRDRNA2_126476_c0_seq1.p1  ORF type:complete len:629 (+),score=136.46 gnl/MRDRNA2_/MRDRNA2_126476_c0_seq1:109-1995(+)